MLFGRAVAARRRRIKSSTLALAAAALYTSLTAAASSAVAVLGPRTTTSPLVRGISVACFATLASSFAALRHASASSSIPDFSRRSSHSSSSSSASPMALAAATGVDVETPSGERMHFVWVPEVNSTQDGMRQLLAAGEGHGKGAAAAAAADVLALGAAVQTKGRGTSGRAWVGLQGNVFLTMALPTAPRDGGGAPLFPFPVTLLPLRIGTIIAKEVSKLLPADKRGLVNLKWPNDVLVGDAKVSGLLIEMDGAGHYLVGVGVNLAHAPEVPNHGADRGRTATSLAQHGAQVSAEAARELSLAIATAVADWFGKRREDGVEAVKAEWEGMAVWGREYRLREDGSVVVPLGLEDDGRLRVRDLASGGTRYLVAEYLH